MATRAVCGFDLGKFPSAAMNLGGEKALTFVGTPIDGGRNGGKMVLAYSYVTGVANVSGSTSSNFRAASAAYIQLIGSPGANTWVVFYDGDSGNTARYNWQLNRLEIVDSNAVVATQAMPASPNNPVVGNWYLARVEAYYVSGTLTLTIEFDGVTLTHTFVHGGTLTAKFWTATNTTYYVDDVIVEDGSGTADNTNGTLPPAVTVRAANPTGDGTTNDFTTTGGATDRADALAAVDAKYCQAGDVGDKQNMAIPNNPGGVTDCRGVNLWVTGSRNAGATPTKLGIGMAIDGSDVASTNGDIVLATAEAEYKGSVFYKAGGARISAADADAMETYFENVA